LNGAGFRGFDREVPTKANKELQAFVYFYQQSVAMNMYPQNDFLKGQIVGRLFGSNTTSNTNIINGNYSLRHRRICGLCSFLNPNSALDKCGIDLRLVINDLQKPLKRFVHRD